MPKSRVYFSIRTTVAKNRCEARNNVVNGLFNEEYAICDKILTLKELLKELEKERD